MHSARSRLGRNIVIALLSAATVTTVFLTLFDWNWLKAPLERSLTTASGRRFSIEGNLVGEWRLKPRIRMERIRIANPDWAQSPDFLTAASVELRIALLPLLSSRRIHLYDLRLVQPVVALERTSDGRATWFFDREQRDPGTAPRIDAMAVDSGLLDYRDVVNRSELKVTLHEDADTTDTNGGLQFTVQGRFRGEAIDLRGSSDSLLALRDTQQALPFTVTGNIAGTRIQLEGNTEPPPKMERLNLHYRVQGPSLKRLSPIFAVPLPETPPYDVAGQLERSGPRWETRTMRGRVGKSDLAGQVLVITGNAKPELNAELRSKLLDLADLGPLIGTRPVDANAAAPVADRLLPQRTFDLRRVDALNARVRLSSQHVVRPGGFPFDNFHADFNLRDAMITIDPLEFGMADGKLRARVTMDARKRVIHTAAAGQVRDVRVAKIFPQEAALGEAAGVLAGSFDLQGQGNSVALMLGTSSGRATLLLADGRIPNLIPALADLDGARIIRSMLGRRPEFVQCAAVDLNVVQGTATPSVALFETESTVLSLTGSVSLRSETLDLRLTQAPKKPSFLSVRTPILISGNLKTPVLAPDPVPLTGRAAAAVVLGLINPLASLFATIEPGPGVDGACPEIRRGLPGQTATRVKVPPSVSPRTDHAPASSNVNG